MSAAERAFAEAESQGLPERIEDAATLSRLAVMLAPTPSAVDRRAA